MHFQISAQWTLSPELKQTKQNFLFIKYSKPLIHILSLTWIFHRIYLIYKTNIPADKGWHIQLRDNLQKGVFLIYQLRFIRSASTIDIIFNISRFDHTIVHESNLKSDITSKNNFFNRPLKADHVVHKHVWSQFPILTQLLHIIDVTVTRGTLKMVTKLTMIPTASSD